MLVKPFLVLFGKLLNGVGNSICLVCCVAVSTVPRCINNVPQYYILKSLDDHDVALFGTAP